ncbi:hypothetical protein niasHT_022442 [Heterodera trifolii]|uniref:Uncharacterized protein n=1 Tax=Heterodera trifolii TaxID=157864 RepID=A0ABD2K8X8_9BILA
MPSNSFYVILPSNTSVDGNRTNSFRVRLPRKIQFNSEWEVGLAVIVYPHSWPSIGTVEEQFVQVDWQTGSTVHIAVPTTNIKNPDDLSKSLYRLLGEGSQPLAQKARTAQLAFNGSASVARQWAKDEYIRRKTREKRAIRDEQMLLDALQTGGTDSTVDLMDAAAQGIVSRERRAETSQIPLREKMDDKDTYQNKLDNYFSTLKGEDLELLDELGRNKLNEEIANMFEEDRTILDATKELGLEAWIQAYKKVRFACKFTFDTHKTRFTLRLDPRYVQRVRMSSQLAYILGFSSTELVAPENEARFMPDMSGGVSSFHVYTPDLIEPMMIGDVTAPVLRIVTIRGQPDEIVEEQFLAIQYHRILPTFNQNTIMNTLEIDNSLANNSVTRYAYVGCFAADKIPTNHIAVYPHCMVLNVDPSTSRGSHWVSLYCLSPMHIEYYDSLGIWPPLTELVQFGGFNVFRGVPYQRGAGVGAVFRSLMRYLLPIGKQIGTAIGRQGLESGNRVLTNVLDGKDLKESLVNESKSGLKNLLEKAANNIEAQKGQGFDFKRYKSEQMPKIGRARHKPINKMHSSISPPMLGKKKRVRVDFEHSPLAINSALNLFSVPPTNVSVVRSFFRQVLPLATITQESPYLFRLYSDNLWTDLSRIYLHLEVSVEKLETNGPWVPIRAEDTNVSAIQAIGLTFVQQLKVTVGNTEVYDSGNLYPFKAYITNELSLPGNVKKHFLGSAGYQPSTKHDDATDTGFKERCKIFQDGRKAQFLSRLDFDLGNQELYLINNLDLLFTIYRAKDSFLIQTLKDNDTTKYRLSVHDVKIYAKMVEVQPSLNMSLYKTLEKQPATYAVRKTEIKSSFISVGRYEFEYNVFSATIPRRVIIAMVSNSAFNGDYKLTPFKFEPFDLREISVHAGGMVYPSVPYKLSFPQHHFTRAFVDVYEALGMANSERSCDITMKQFKMGWTFFIIPLSSTLDDSCGFELLRSGTTTIRATFDSPIPKGGVEMVVLGEFDQMIMVDYNRHIVSDSKLG